MGHVELNGSRRVEWVTIEWVMYRDQWSRPGMSWSRPRLGHVRSGLSLPVVRNSLDSGVKIPQIY